ncbi:MAG: hypothetical protein JNK15_05145 [Planctomycetes bacterium]|nr:hypothetical protein [Planctomycetota bacterium]
MRFVSLAFLLAAPLAAQGSLLTTTFAGGNGQNGNMFDITATNAVVISGFDVNLSTPTADIEVYAVTGGGTFVGKESNAALWTLVGTATGVVNSGNNVATSVPIAVNVPIAAGQSMGFYVTTTAGGGVNYTNGTGVGNVFAQDANIQFREGVGKSYPFATTFTPRIWNGNIYYVLAAGQSLTTTFGNLNTISAGNMFDVTALQNVAITGCDVSLDPGVWDLAVYTLTNGSTYVGNETNAAAWTLLGSAIGVVSNGFNVPTPLPIAINSSIGAGQTRAFYITCTNGNGMNYIGGTSAGAVYAQDANIQIREGAGLQTPFTTVFTPRVWNGTLRYATIPLNSAVNTAVGAGCGYEFRSVYEQFTSGALSNNPFDLNGTALRWTNAGTFYVVDNVVASFVAPTAAAVNVAPGLLDGQQAFTLTAPMPVPGGTTTTLNVCTKGYVATGVGNGIDYTPTGAELIAFPETTWACWADYDQTILGSGLILYEQVGGVAYVTWNGVRTYQNAAASNTFQFQFNIATGNVTLVVNSVGAAAAWPVVVGYSPGGTSLNPGSKDISALVGAGAIFLDPSDRAVTLSALSLPLIGSTWQLGVGNIPANGVIGVEVFGLTDPLLDDLTVIGMPFCGLRASLDVLNAWFIGSSTHVYGLSIPNSLYLMGLNIHTTTAVFQVPAVNPFGAITSRGLRGTIGNQ